MEWVIFGVYETLFNCITMFCENGSIYDRGEPAVSYKWTGWVWEIPVEVQYCRNRTDHFRGVYRIYPNLIKEHRRMSTCNWLDLQTLGSQPIMPKNLPIVGQYSAKHSSHLVQMKEYSTKYCQSHWTLLWIWIMSCT